MRQATWRLGLYSKVVLTIIAVSLVGLLVRQLPKKVEAQRYGNIRVGVVQLTVSLLRNELQVYLEQDKEREKEGRLPLLDPGLKALAQRIFDYPGSDIKQLLDSVLVYKYALGYRAKLMTADFIILESE